LAIADDFPNFVIGFISQKRISTNPAHLHLSPGIQFARKDDSLGQRYTTPEESIGDNKSDIIIVGRGILSEIDRVDSAIEYKKRGYNAYLKRLGRQKINGFQ
jgi:orotidine-5'-phosphate decarboxylase